ncbi:MAG: hypothetical protein QM766_25385 [Burkholderiaceae bacterium]
MSGPLTRLLAITFSCWASAVIAQPVRPPLPFEARSETLLPAGRIAGRTVTISRFDSALDVDRAIDETRRQWRQDSRFEVVEGTSGKWRTLSRRDGASTVTLQIQGRRGGGSHGLLSVWAADSGPLAGKADTAEQRLRAILPPGASTLRTLSSIDGDRVAATLVATHDGPLAALWSRLVASIEAQGFRQSDALALPAHVRDARAAAFLRGGDELMVTMDARGARLGIVMHLIEAKR